ncbi:MAG TPA: arsenate reductase ArsC [Gemmatimonadaceae bacterium]|nr:arsenate reductase ArsC [Gemmatimonadaceae bacterium]
MVRGDRQQSFRVLVLCTGNSARSQIAEALLATRGAGRVEAASAGSRPAVRVHPLAVDVLREHGIAWEGRTPNGIEDVAGERFDLVITVCDNARDACPFFPGAGAQVHWGLPDPVEEPDPKAARRAFLETYDALVARVDALLALPLECLAPAALQARAQAVHASTSVGGSPGTQ